MIRTVVVGAGGYSGAELTGLLAAHEHAELAGLFGSAARGASENSRQFASEFPRWRGVVNMPIHALNLADLLATEPHTAFLATPPEVSHEIAPALIERDIVVFDLSAAFRLASTETFAKHYGFAHAHGGLLANAVYGLPELFRNDIQRASLIAMPGCYPTSIVLPMATLRRAGAIGEQFPIIADCTSGVSGAGRHPALKSMFCEVSSQPYAVMNHRHQPEIEQYVGGPVIFTPHLGPFDRGIASTIHAPLANGWSGESVRAALHDALNHEPFVRLLPAGHWPTVGAVRGTNYCDIAVAVDEKRRHIIVASAIDNLLKGAAGQAVQCFNERFSFPAETGLMGGAKCLVES